MTTHDPVRDAAIGLAIDRGVDPGVDIALRPMRWWDLDRVMVIEQASFRFDAWTPETFWSELAERDSRRYLVAEVASGDLFGYVGISAVAGEADVQTIATSPAARGLGVGRMLLRAGIAEAVAAGARRIHLEVRADNAAALALYATAGFRRVSRRKGYYHDPGGARTDALVMTLDLTATERPPRRRVLS